MARIQIESGRAHSHYGPRSSEDKLPTKHVRQGGVETLELVFSYDDLPGGSTDNANLYIPAGSFIESARIQVITAFAGGTSLDFGLEQSDGSTAIDADGIDAAVATAAINAANEVVLCDGALVQATAGIGANDGYLVVAATGTYTAGKAKIIVNYIPNKDRAE